MPLGRSDCHTALFTSVKVLAVNPGLLAVFLGSQWRVLFCVVFDEVNGAYFAL
jgi:hypothetical protein